MDSSVDTTASNKVFIVLPTHGEVLFGQPHHTIGHCRNDDDVDSSDDMAAHKIHQSEESHSRYFGDIAVSGSFPWLFLWMLNIHQTKILDEGEKRFRDEFGQIAEVNNLQGHLPERDARYRFYTVITNRLILFPSEPTSDILPSRQGHSSLSSIFRVNNIYLRGQHAFYKCWPPKEFLAEHYDHKAYDYTFQRLEAALFSLAARFMILPILCSSNPNWRDGYNNNPLFYRIIPDVSIFSVVVPEHTVRDISLVAGDRKGILVSHATVKYNVPDIVSEDSPVPLSLWPKILARAWRMRHKYAYPIQDGIDFETRGSIKGATAMFRLIQMSNPLKFHLTTTVLGDHVDPTEANESSDSNAMDDNDAGSHDAEISRLITEIETLSTRLATLKGKKNVGKERSAKRKSVD